MRRRGDGQRRSTKVVALLAVTALTMAACGESDDSAAPGDETTTTAPRSTTTEAAAQGDLVAFCDALVAIDSDTGPEIDFETATDEEQMKAIQEYAATFEPKLQAAEETAPEEVAEAVNAAGRLVRGGLETGDDSFFESPEFTEAEDTIDQYALGNCGFEEVDVTGTEYAFEGVPETLGAGQTAFAFANDGSELHELALFRINDDAEGTFEELLQLPEEEAMTMGTPVGFAFAAPGEADSLFLDLEPGRYGLVCFLPVGSTPDSDEEAIAENPPHFTQGMLAEFTVE